MERVSTLIKKLQKQLDEKASTTMLLHTVQMLQAELQSQTETKKEVKQEKVSVIMPLSYSAFQQVTTSKYSEGAVSEDKIIEILQVDEKAIEEELEQIKRNAESVTSMSTHARPRYVYDPIEDVPTLAHQAPLEIPGSRSNEIPFEYQESLNDRLKEIKKELSEKLTEAPIK
ncbi:MAG: hypothetical protein ACRDE5_14120, partial [Ginsengibacter sp.]